MQARLTIFVLLSVSLVFGLLFARQLLMSRGLPHERFLDKKIRVLSYTSFIDSAGPGPAIFDRFRSEHKCDIEVVSVPDAGLLLERLKLNAGSAPFDLVIGLDRLLLSEARKVGSWRAHEANVKGLNSAIPLDIEFLPLDWSPLSFIYRKGEIEPPVHFSDLTLPRFKNSLALQDPHASTPGLQFYNWVRALERNSSEFFTRLQPNVQSVSPSWAFSYGMFKKSQAKMVFTYLTSLAFHYSVEHNREYRAVELPEGHVVQIEFSGVPTTCHECALALALERSFLEPWAQKLIMERNYMFPVKDEVRDATVFAQLPQLKTVNDAEFDVQKLGDWDQVFKK